MPQVTHRPALATQLQEMRLKAWTSAQAGGTLTEAGAEMAGVEGEAGEAGENGETGEKRGSPGG